MATELTILTEYRKNINILRVKNPLLLDPSLAEAMTNALVKAFDSGDQKILLDVGPVMRMSSLFFRSFIIAGKRAKACNATLAFCNVAPAIKAGFEMMGLDKYFPLYANETVAIDSMK